MKRIYDWLAKANQVLLFFVMLGGIALIYELYQSSHRFEPPHVEIAQTSEEAAKSVVEDINFLGRSSSGIYILGIVKHLVKPEKEPWGSSMAHLGSADLSQTVNIVFSKGDGRLLTLLPKDGLVLSNNIYDQPSREKIKSLLFRCVTEDTDGNHRLDANDRTDLYLVAEDLEKPNLVIKGALQDQVIGAGHLAVKTKEGEAIHFWDIDTSTHAKNEIVWK